MKLEIADILTPQLIRLDLKARNKQEALNELADLLDKAGKLTSRQEFLKLLSDREAHGSTGIGMGVAIPHGKGSVVKEMAVAFAKSEAGVDFEALDGQKSHLFFVIAAPEGGEDAHLRAVAKLARALMNQDFRRKLRDAEKPEEVLEVIKNQGV